MIKLTDKDKLVFHTLVKWPDLNDIQLSKKINVKRPTVTAIRNKLEKNGLYTTTKVPDLERIGCELLTVRYGSFNPLTPYEVREKYVSTHKFPEVFYKRTTDRERIALSAATNFTEAKKYIEYSNQIYGKQGFLTDEGIIHVFFPFKVTKIFKLFDYAPLLKQHFNLQTEEEKIDIDTTFQEHEAIELSENEKKVFYALIKYPQQNDSEIAKKVSMARQRVSVMRKKFEKEELIKTIRIPDMKALGFNLLVLTHILVNPKSPLDERKHGIEKILKQANHIIHISGNLEIILISEFEDYEAYKKTHDDLVDYYKQHDLLHKDPTTRILLNTDIKLQMNTNYAPLLKKIFNIKNEV